MYCDPSEFDSIDEHEVELDELDLVHDELDGVDLIIQDMELAESYDSYLDVVDDIPY